MSKAHACSYCGSFNPPGTYNCRGCGAPLDPNHQDDEPYPSDDLLAVAGLSGRDHSDYDDELDDLDERLTAFDRALDVSHYIQAVVYAIITGVAIWICWPFIEFMFSMGYITFKTLFGLIALLF